MAGSESLPAAAAAAAAAAASDEDDDRASSLASPRGEQQHHHNNDDNNNDHRPVLEIDTANDDDDDDDGPAGVSLSGNDTISLSSSVRNFRTENGRSYHAYKEGSYHLPNDEKELDRLDLQFHLSLLTLDNKLHLAPLGERVGRVLDVATGTGIWAIEFAYEHPEAQIIGNDLSPTQPNNVPPNVTFEVDDAEADWTYTEKFDFIHSGFLCSSFKNYPRYFEQAFEFLNPGGWIEAFEGILPPVCDDASIPPDSALATWSALMTAAARAVGVRLDAGQDYAALMRGAGFEGVAERRFQWASNPWPKRARDKRIGWWNEENMTAGLEGFSMAFFTRWLGWKSEEVEVLLAGVRRDLRDRSIHSYCTIVCVYGQKPLT